MALSHGGEEKVNDVSSALDELSKKWRIDSIVRDVHLRKRKDIQDYYNQDKPGHLSSSFFI